eukprot:10332712-Lingulodinium_polyedra.AAC.1
MPWSEEWHLQGVVREPSHGHGSGVHVEGCARKVGRAGWEIEAGRGEAFGSGRTQPGGGGPLPGPGG